MANNRRRRKHNNQNHSATPIKPSSQTKRLERTTGHGFQEFSSLKDLHDFFSDPDNNPDASVEPPLINRQKKPNPSKGDKARSQGKR